MAHRDVAPVETLGRVTGGRDELEPGLAVRSDDVEHVQRVVLEAGALSADFELKFVLPDGEAISLVLTTAGLVVSGAGRPPS